MGITIYKGMRIDGDAQVMVMTETTWEPLPIRLDVIEHSPDGFEWGYAGSGPAQLAIALCLDALGGNDPDADCCNTCHGQLNTLGRCHCPIPKQGTYSKAEEARERARNVYHTFMVEHISRLAGPRIRNDEWSFTGNQVREWIEAIEARS